MKNIEILQALIKLEYSPEYICLAFTLNGNYYADWFLNLINTDKQYSFLRKAMKPTIIQDFLKTMNDNTVDLNKYFKMQKVLERADRYLLKKHRIVCYSKIMNVDLNVAYHLYCLDEKQAEYDMWNTVYERTLGEDYKEKYPIHYSNPKAYYIDTKGKLRNIAKDRDRKQYYLYGTGVMFK